MLSLFVAAYAVATLPYTIYRIARTFCPVCGERIINHDDARFLEDGEAAYRMVVCGSVMDMRKGVAISVPDIDNTPSGQSGQSVPDNAAY